MTISTPLLPQAPAGSDNDRFHSFLQQVLEDIAESPRMEGIQEAEFLDVLAAIDTMPVGFRTELGKLLVTWLRKTAHTPAGHVSWQTRRYMSTEGPQLLFSVASRYSQEIQNGFGLLVRLRHQQLLDAQPATKDTMSVGILLTPRHDGRRPWDTSLCATYGDQNLTREERAELELLWPSSTGEDLADAGL